MIGADDTDGDPMFQGAELFQLLTLFERGGGEAHQLAEDIATIAVDSKMEQGRDGALRIMEITMEGNAASGEVELSLIHI